MEKYTQNDWGQESLCFNSSAISHQSGFGGFHTCSVPQFIPLSVRLGQFCSSRVMESRRCLKDKVRIFVDCKV